jgi:lipoprotein Spr
MYLGKRSFLHVSETKGVTVSSLADSYWQDHYWQARRVFR